MTNILIVSTLKTSKHVCVVGDYSYVKRDRPVWLTAQRKLELTTSCKLDSSLGSEVSPAYSGCGHTMPRPLQTPPPPSLPPKTASLLREVGVRPFKHDGSPEPYLFPVFMKQRARTQGSNTIIM